MIAARDCTHNREFYPKGAKIDLPEGDMAILEDLGFLEPDPKPKAPVRKDDA